MVKQIRCAGLLRKTGLGLLAAGLSGLVGLSAVSAAGTAKTVNARHAAWREAIIAAAVPGKGCFTAAYPSTQWKQVACVKAPARPLMPARGPSGFVVGNGNDYSAETGTPITTATGSFPSIKGLKSETDEGESDAYSLQLNSSYYQAPVCNGASNPSQCRAWIQYAYVNESPSDGSAFIEVWLINYGASCPAGFSPFPPDCYANSDGADVPNQTLAQLQDIQVTGTTVSGGDDTVKVTTATGAYAATLPDSMIDTAGNWNTAEYNVFGDGGGSEAVFNPGTKMKVKVQLQDGSTIAPICITDGFTLESNNLGLNQCKASGGKKPSITFSQSN